MLYGLTLGMAASDSHSYHAKTPVDLQAKIRYRIYENNYLVW